MRGGRSDRQTAVVRTEDIEGVGWADDVDWVGETLAGVELELEPAADD